jgi:hypothetical protein
MPASTPSSTRRATARACGLPAETLDNTGHDVGATLSLALDPTGKPSVAYYDATEGDLEYARFDGIQWKRSTLDYKNITGQFPSLAFQSNGHPIVTYFRKTSRDLRFSRSDGTNWTRGEVDTVGDVGSFDSLSVAKNGTIGVAYGDTTNGDVKYAQWNGTRGRRKRFRIVWAAPRSSRWRSTIRTSRRSATTTPSPRTWSTRPRAAARGRATR